MQLINEGKIIAGKLREYLEKHQEVENMLQKKSRSKFFSTDLTEKFEIMGSKFFGKKIKPERAKLE